MLKIVQNCVVKRRNAVVYHGRLGRFRSVGKNRPKVGSAKNDLDRPKSTDSEHYLGDSGNKTSINNGVKNFNKTFNWLEQLEDIRQIGKDVSQSISEGVAVNLGEKFSGTNPSTEALEKRHS